MTDDKKLRRGWEHRFPSLSEEWTHWWIEGDGALVAIVATIDLGAALDIVSRHHDRCRWIIVYPAKLNPFGEIIRDGTRGYEIEGRNKTG
jgi:hypothetical protein